MHLTIQSKGKVERQFHFVETSLLNGRTFETLAHLNEVTAGWLTNVADARVLRDFKETPRQRHAVEQPHLLGDPQPGRVNVRERVDTLGEGGDGGGEHDRIVLRPNDKNSFKKAQLWTTVRLWITSAMILRANVVLGQVRCCKPRQVLLRGHPSAARPCSA